MSSEILLSTVFLLLLVGCASILWFFLDNAKKRRRPHKQVITKWLFTPCPNGLPKELKCSVNSTEEQWLSTMEQLKAAFSNASSPVTFGIVFHFLPSSPLDFIVPFDLINEVTGEKLYLKQYENAFWLIRCPIGWDGRNWRKVLEELSARQNPIDILIRDGGYDDGLLLDDASPGSSDH